MNFRSWFFKFRFFVILRLVFSFYLVEIWKGLDQGSPNRRVRNINQIGASTPGLNDIKIWNWPVCTFIISIAISIMLRSLFAKICLQRYVLLLCKSSGKGRHIMGRLGSIVRGYLVKIWAIKQRKLSAFVFRGRE